MWTQIPFEGIVTAGASARTIVTAAPGVRVADTVPPVLGCLRVRCAGTNTCAGSRLQNNKYTGNYGNDDDHNDANGDDLSLSTAGFWGYRGSGSRH